MFLPKRKNYKISKKLAGNLLITFWLVIAVLTFAKFTSDTLAATKYAGVLEISFAGSDPLFFENNIMPGFSQTKSLSVKNTGSKNHSFAIAATSPLGDLASQIDVTARDQGSASTIWTKKLNQIAASPSSTLIYPSISPGETKNLDISFSLPTSTGNSYQNKSTLVFDFIMGNESTDESEGGGTNGPTTLGLAGETGGSVGGGLLTLSRGAIGGQATVEPPLIEEEIQLEPPTEEVKGVTSEDKEVKGKSSCESSIWWWILLLLFAIILLIYGFLIKNKKDAIWRYLPPVAVGLIIYLIYLLINRECCSNYFWCKYFLLILILELVIYELISYFTQSKDKQEKEPQPLGF